MFHPVGPQPAYVYWRRRIVVLAGLVAVVAFVSSLFTGGDNRRTDHAGAASSAPGTPSPAGSARPALTITPSPGSAGPPVTEPAGGSGDRGGTGACADSVLRVTVGTDQPTYRVGDHPTVRLTVTNTSDAACVRDVGAAQQEIVISSGGQRVWSSDDCAPGGAPDERMIAAGETLHFSVTWPGRSSQPGCPTNPPAAPAGTYTLVGRLGTIHSEPVTLTLQP